VCINCFSDIFNGDQDVYLEILKAKGQKKKIKDYVHCLAKKKNQEKSKEIWRRKKMKDANRKNVKI